MRVGRFMYNTQVFYGILEGNKVFPLQDEPFKQITRENQVYPLEQLKVLAPCKPTKIICIGLNYRDHADEFGYAVPEEPILFIKPSTTVIGPGAGIIYPASSKQIDYEAELAVVIGKQCRGVAAKKAREYIFGYTCGNDVTARDLQHKDGQWTRAKSFDTFLPLGPYIIKELNTEDLSLTLRLNGVIRQSSSTKNLIFNVPSLISFISGVMTLYPGDVILTGTPGGVGSMKIGDTVEVEIEGIGKLTNTVRSQNQP